MNSYEFNLGAFFVTIEAFDEDEAFLNLEKYLESNISNHQEEIITYFLENSHLESSSDLETSYLSSYLSLVDRNK